MINRFKYAFQGLFHIFKFDKNLRLHVFLFLILIVAGFLTKLTMTEWLIILLCAAIVFSLEIINSIFEYLADFIHPDYHPRIKIIKDVSAGLVLLFSFFSCLIAALIFLPKWIN